MNSSTGISAQDISYDEFCVIQSDKNPGFQPFGFAGGLYDNDTKLVLFGASHYDPTIGRWTTKDPIGFRGGDTNLYSYVGGNPIGNCANVCMSSLNGGVLTTQPVQGSNGY